jgi:hypothetical protein
MRLSLITRIWQESIGDDCRYRSFHYSAGRWTQAIEASPRVCIDEWPLRITISSKTQNRNVRRSFSRFCAHCTCRYIVVQYIGLWTMQGLTYCICHVSFAWFCNASTLSTRTTLRGRVGYPVEKRADSSIPKGCPYCQPGGRGFLPHISGGEISASSRKPLGSKKTAPVNGWADFSTLKK